jgi:hypothetical protein
VSPKPTPDETDAEALRHLIRTCWARLDAQGRAAVIASIRQQGGGSCQRPPSERKPSGAVRIRARVAGLGDLHYRGADGRGERIERRDAAALFDAMALITLIGAPLVVGNDHVLGVTRDDARAVGRVVAARGEGDFIVADIEVAEATVIERLKSGELGGFSCGYTARVKQVSAGEYVQSRLRFQHVALGPPGCGRGGPELRVIEIEDPTSPAVQQGSL